MEFYFFPFEIGSCSAVHAGLKIWIPLDLAFRVAGTTGVYHPESFLMSTQGKSQLNPQNQSVTLPWQQLCARKQDISYCSGSRMPLFTVDLEERDRLRL